MRHDELLRVVTETSADQWIRLSGEPVLASVRVYGGGPEVEIVRHTAIAFLRSDLDIRLQWGAPQNNGEPWDGAWVRFAEHLPDPEVHGLYVDLCWRGQP